MSNLKKQKSNSVFLSKHNSQFKSILIYILCIILISFALAYCISKHLFYQTVKNNVSEKYTLKSYPVYIILRDSYDVIPVLDLSDEIFSKNVNESYAFDSADITAVVSHNQNDDFLTVTLIGVEYSGDLFIYDSIQNICHNVPSFSKEIYAGKYKIAFSNTDEYVTVTFTCLYD